MKETWSRRSALGSILFSVALGSYPLRAASGLRLPKVPMQLSRRLVRSLSDGHEIVVERDWLVGFTSRTVGAVISGRQIDARVQAPTRIARIAEIERNRSTDAMFPILLDSGGLIVETGEMQSPQDVAQAVALAQEMIARSPQSASQKSQAEFYLAQIEHAGGGLLDQLPHDLFYPRDLQRHDKQPVNLPGGATGEFELVYSAQVVPGNAWLARLDRRVVTRFGGSESTSSERWRMRPA